MYLRIDYIMMCSPNVFKYCSMIVYRLLYTKRRAKEAEKPKAKSLRSHGRMGDESEVKIKHVEDYN